jgi:SAM-dependent methyltransferase
MIAFLSKFLKKQEETPMAEAEPPPQEAAPLPVASAPANEEGVDLSKLELSQKMWGPGFSKPGNKEFILSLTRPLTLDSKKTMLDLTAGLGGAIRAVTDTFKTYVEGYERNAKVAALGMELSTRSGHGKRAPITHYDPLNFEYPKHVDVVFARELLYTLPDKQKFMENVSNWLKARGQVVMIEFTADNEVLKKPAVAQWIAGELYGATPLSGPDMVTLFGKNGFDLRVNEDITAYYRKEIIFGLAKLVQNLEGPRLTRDTKARVAELVEYWARRAQALEEGVKVTRYYAIKNSPVRAPN